MVSTHTPLNRKCLQVYIFEDNNFKPDVSEKYIDSYEYNGCYYHHCPNNCYIVSKIKNKAWLDKLEKTKEKDVKRRNFLISEGYNVITIQ